MRLTPLETRIVEITNPVIEDLGFAPFTVRMTSNGGQQICQIMAEDPKTRRLGVDDCAKISRAVSAIMDVEDPISGNYRLEVSSPGIDRMLVRIEDYEYYKGLDAKIESDTPAENGQRKFRGHILGADNNTVKLNTDQGEVEIPFPSIIKAKLVLNDELIKLTANKEEKE
ncbi:MAG: ribosome maturation factor RimP [Bdellovibrionales bacterium]